MKSSHIPVLIIGAGPVGIAIAAMLRRHGIAARIVDRSSGPTPYSKAVGMHARTLEAMHALGLSEQLVSDGQPLADFRLVDGARTIMQASFQNMGSAYEFVLGIPQSCTERRLLSRLQACGGDVEWQTEFTELVNCGLSGETPTLAVARLTHADGSEERISCNWLIGADGGRSLVRQKAGIEFRGGDYGNAFILGDARIDWDGPRGELQFFLSPHGYLLLVPMPQGLHRIIAQTNRKYDEFQEASRPQATLEELQRIVDLNGPGGIRVHSPQWLTCAPFYHRLADTPLKGRTLLAGDAFHLFSPLGAQGLNTGFQDCFNLAWKIAFVERGWAPDSLLGTYREEREPMARLIGEVTSRTTRYITTTHPVKRFLRRHLTRLLNPGERIQKRLPQLLAGMLQSYGPQATLSGSGGKGLPAAGGRIPHAWIADGHGYRPLASLIHGTVYSLLLSTPRLSAGLVEEVERFCALQRARLPFLQVLILTREIDVQSHPLPSGVRLIEDRLGEARARLGCSADATVLVRPDGYCALSAHGIALEEIGHYFARHGMQATVAEPALRQEAGHAS